MDESGPSGAQPRIAEIDTARGFGLLLMVLGHILTLDSRVHSWIYSFHMPLFFFLSGLVLRPSAIADFRGFAARTPVDMLRTSFAGIAVCLVVTVALSSGLCVIGERLAPWMFGCAKRRAEVPARAVHAQAPRELIAH